MSHGRFSLRRQLPVHSPLPASALAQAIVRFSSRDCPHRRLRRLVAERFHADHVVLYGSGTQALTVGIRLARTRAGLDAPVALPAYTCYDIATAAIGADTPLVLYDVDPETLAPDWTSFESALRTGARVAVLGPLYGFPFNWSAATELAERYGAVLIEDAAQAAGGEWDGRPIGTFGALTVLSFGRGKGWTGGNGGALLIREPAGCTRTFGASRSGDGPADTADPVTTIPDPPPASATTELATAVASAAQWLMARPAIYGLPYALPMLHLGETMYHPPQAEEGMTRTAAVLALATERASRLSVEERRRAADRVRALASAGDVPIRPISLSPESCPGYLRFPCLSPPEGLDHRRLRGLGRYGVETGYPTTLAELPAVSRRLARPGAPHFPGAEILARQLITLPTHTLAGERDWSAIFDILQDARLRG